MIKYVKTLVADEYGRNVLLNYIFRIAAIVLGLIATRVNLNYLGITIYGLWTTITSVISWMNSGDLGIGNGLRNALAKAYGENDVYKQDRLIDAAIGYLGKLSVVLLIIIVIVCEVFFRTNILEQSLRIPMYITAVFFCVNLVLGVSQSVAFSYQKSWLNTLTASEIQFFAIVVVFVFESFMVEANLALFAFANGLCTTLPNIILILLLKKKHIHVFRKQSNYKKDKEIKKSIMNTGLQFFGIQLCAVVLYSTDSLLINKLISSDMVTKYSLITKIYDTGTGLFSILLIAFWSGVTYHIAQNDYRWIKNKVSQLVKWWVVFSLGVIIVSLGFNNIVQIWIGVNAQNYEPELVGLFGIYCIMTAYSAIFVNVLNGFGAVKLQLKLAVIEAIVNIPLSIFFAKYCSMGIFGIKFATFLCALLTAVIMPVQAIILLKRGTRNEDSSSSE